MVKKLGRVLAAAVLIWAAAVPAGARTLGSIEVSIGGPSETGAVVELHRVGEASGEYYRLPDAFGGGVIRREDGCDPELAQWLAGHVGEDGTRRLLDADGKGLFSNLEEGLYLLLQRQAPEGYACALPCLIPVPLEGQWEIRAEPKTARLLTQSPQTGDSFQPLVWAMGMILSGMGLWAFADKIGKNRRK